MANPFVHIELNTNNLGAAKEFYTKLFDWKLEEHQMPSGPYTTINVGEGTGGGMWENTACNGTLPNGIPSHWLAYIHVEDIVASTEKAKELGGTVVQEIKNVGDFGALSVIIDPRGAAFALWQNSNVAEPIS